MNDSSYPIYPDVSFEHALIVKNGYGKITIAVRCLSLVRFAEKGIYYTVLHKDVYKEDFMSGEISVENAMKVQAKAFGAFIRNVEVSKMQYTVDPTLQDHEGNMIHREDPDQTPENERLQNKYRPLLPS